MGRDVFISYRRDGGRLAASSIHRYLKSEYGPKRIFLDTESIPPGADFRRVLEDRIAGSAVLVVVMQPGWASQLTRSGECRLEDANDFVRLELEIALLRGLPIVPVLVNGYQMPRPEELPESIRPVATRHAVEIVASRAVPAVGLESIEVAVRPFVSRRILTRTTYAAAYGVGILSVFLAIITSFLAIIPLIGLSEEFGPEVVSGRKGRINFDHMTGPGIMGLQQLALPLVGALSVGFMVAGAVLNRRYLNVWRLLLMLLAYCAVLGSSFINWLFRDSFWSLNTQFTLNLLVIALSIYVISVLVSMPADNRLLVAAKSISVAIVFILGLVFPAMFDIMFLSVRLNVISSFELTGGKVVGWIALFCGIGLAGFLMSRHQPERSG